MAFVDWFEMDMADDPRMIEINNQYHSIYLDIRLSRSSVLTVDAVYFPRNGGNVTLVITKVTSMG